MSADALEIAEYLRALYGYENGGDAPGLLAIFTLPNRQTEFVDGDDLFDDTPNRIATLAVEQHVYHAVALQRQRVSGRGKADNAYAVPSMFLDIDVRGPHHAAAALPETRDDALDFLASLPLEPTVVIDSGGGFQVHWCFHELQVLETERDREIATLLSSRVQDGIRQRAAQRGWQLDNTADLARVLRVAGTLNHKSDPPVAVRMLYCSDARYQPNDLVALCEPKPRSTAAPVRVASSTPKDRRIQLLLDRIGSRAEGDRDNTAFRIACWLVRDFALSDPEALAWLSSWNAGNQPPLPERELERKIKSAHSSGRRIVGSAA